MSIFKACDVRGIVGRQWDVTEARQIGLALGRLASNREETEFCVAGDFRRSTPRLKQALIAGLTAAGMQVHDVGQVPTPVAHFAAVHLQCRNVAIVTASHNPSQYNGVKFVLAGRPAVPELVDELQRNLNTPSGPTVGRVRQANLLASYVPWVQERADEFLDATPASQRAAVPDVEPPLVVVDAMEGACTELAPRILSAGGFRRKTIGGGIDPDFARRTPNPADYDNLIPLVDAVRKYKATAGLALDGDGDRVIFVDHTGSIVRPEQLAAVLVRHCLKRPTVVYDLKCASILAREVQRAEGIAIMRPSGYGFIKTTMIERNADLGVEVSGHHFFGTLGGGDDGIFTALVVLGLLARSGRSLAELVEPIGWPTITPDLRIPFEGDAPAAIERIAAGCRMPVSRLDGVRADYGDGWALARASITEPAITFRFEGTDSRRVREILSDFLATMPDLCDAALTAIPS